MDLWTPVKDQNKYGARSKKKVCYLFSDIVILVSICAELSHQAYP